MREMRTAVRPHTSDPAILRDSAQAYRRGKTPEITPEGGVRELDLAPGGPEVAAKHLHEIDASFGDAGVRRTLHGLQVTRGNQFVLQMLGVDPGLRRLTERAEHRSGIPAPVSGVLHSNQVGNGLPESVRARFEGATGHDIADVRLLDDRHAHEAAASVGARAFTFGRRIYFGRGEYDPGSDTGRELIYHELFHAVQQRDAGMPADHSIEVSNPGDAYEQQADAAAHAVSRSSRSTGANDGEETMEPAAGADLLSASPVQRATLQRVITFGTTVGSFSPHNVVANEDAAGFVLTSPVGTFQWEPDVTIHGNAGDVFTDWEVAHHQVGKAFWLNVFWGTGADRTHRRRVITGGLPMRDATAAGNTWYSDFRAQGFAADGDVRSPVMRDTPSTGRIPWANPVAGRGGTRGWFNYGFGFVSTLSARHIPDGTGAGAFRHLNHVHWNFSIDGDFDATAAVGGRVTANGGNINRSGMIPGVDVDNRPMHGGPIINDNFSDTDT
jgi:hypothetical protein